MNNHMQGSFIPEHRCMKQGLLKYLNMPLPIDKQLFFQVPKCLHTIPISQVLPLGSPWSSPQSNNEKVLPGKAGAPSNGIMLI